MQDELISTNSKEKNIKNTGKFTEEDIKDFNIQMNQKNDEDYIEEEKKKKVNHEENMYNLNENTEDSLFNLSLATHPIVCLFHLSFKFLAILSYLFLSLLTSSSVHTFITSIILLCLDFWYVKNISGRILVGLRWWNKEDFIDEEGWILESYDIDIDSSSVDKYVFWWALIANTGFWAVVFFFKFISLSFFWGILCFIGFGLNGLNLYGYYLCKKDYELKLQTIIENFGKHRKDIFKLLRNSFTKITS